jgi:hypothetical protein
MYFTCTGGAARAGAGTAEEHRFVMAAAKPACFVAKAFMNRFKSKAISAAMSGYSPFRRHCPFSL